MPEKDDQNNQKSNYKIQCEYCCISVDEEEPETAEGEHKHNPSKDDKTVFISNLNFKVDEERLKETFSKVKLTILAIILFSVSYTSIDRLNGLFGKVARVNYAII